LKNVYTQKKFILLKILIFLKKSKFWKTFKLKNVHIRKNVQNFKNINFGNKKLIVKLIKFKLKNIRKNKKRSSRKKRKRWPPTRSVYTISLNVRLRGKLKKRNEREQLVVSVRLIPLDQLNSIQLMCWLINFENHMWPCNWRCTTLLLPSIHIYLANVYLDTF
jgi:hypothetical protein